jgi:DNA-3-methyladenine glycosylase
VADLIDLLRRDVLKAAPALLGATIVWGDLRARVVETEAYRGEDDPACHAYGKTKMRNMGLFGEPGRAYIYFNYGVHWMLNITAHEPGHGAGILFRAAEPLSGLNIMRTSRMGQSGRQIEDRNLLSGPGKLCRAFGITGEQNGLELIANTSGLHIVPAEHPVTNVIRGPRVGIAKGKWHEVPWRFVDGDRLNWVSAPKPHLPRTE